MRDQHFLERRLHARREIVVPLRERLVRLARRAEPLLEICEKRRPSTGVRVASRQRHLRRPGSDA